MTVSRLCLFACALFLCACANQEGIYEPACVAYEGDVLTLQGGRFEWRRFTDERKVDADGKKLTPFPGFPKNGTYRVSAGRLELVTDDKVRLEDWIFVDREGRRRLLSSEQYSAFRRSGELPECALELKAANTL